MKPRLLLLASQLYAPVGHREKALVEILAARFDLSIITLSPPRFLYQNPIERSPLVLLGKWWRTKLFSPKHLAVEHDGRLLLPRPPLPLDLKPPLIIPQTRDGINKFIAGKRFDAAIAFSPLTAAGFLRSEAAGKMPLIYDDSDRYEHFYSTSLGKKKMQAIEAEVIQKADAVISAGYKMGETAAKIRGGAVEVVTNGLYYERFSSNRPQFGADVVMVYIGSFEPWMGIDNAVRVLSMLPDNFSLMLIGDGRTRPAVEKLIEQLGVRRRVKLTGMVAPKQVGPLLSEAHLGLSLYPHIPLMENAFTLKILEYLASGLPTAATDVGDAGKIIRRASGGLVVDSNLERAAEQIREFAGDTKKMSEAGVSGRKFAADFDWSKIGEKYIEIVSRFCAAKP